VCFKAKECPQIAQIPYETWRNFWVDLNSVGQIGEKQIRS